VSGEAKVPPRPKKFKRAQPNVKQMMIFAYDCEGVIMTDRWYDCNCGLLPSIFAKTET